LKEFISIKNKNKPLIFYKMKRTFNQQAKQIIKVLGFNNLYPYSKLYGTVDTTWGGKTDSMWCISFTVDTQENIVSFEVNKKYFSTTIEEEQAAMNLIKSFKI